MFNFFDKNRLNKTQTQLSFIKAVEEAEKERLKRYQADLSESGDNKQKGIDSKPVSRHEDFKKSMAKAEKERARNVAKQQKDFEKAVAEAEEERARSILAAKLEKLSTGLNLPNIEAPVVKQKNEICHYCSGANRLVSKIVTVGYEGSSSGMSFRIAPGVRLYSGSHRGNPIKRDILESYPGTIVITNKRIVFISIKKPFTVPYRKLVSVTPYNDGYGLQKESMSYLMELPEAQCFGAILNGAINNYFSND